LSKKANKNPPKHSVNYYQAGDLAGGLENGLKVLVELRKSAYLHESYKDG
jgi:hypothetical protein